MNAIEDIIEKLKKLEGQDRDLDKKIAKILVWKRTSARLKDGAKDNEEERIARLVSKPKDDGEVPNYTGSVQQAYIFARQIAPRETGGASWENGAASAKIGSDPVVYASTPQLALLIGALANLMNRLLPDASPN
ncbi:hypothetical protein KX729_18990 [Rhizobium sp. XQZ8]|uniref:hypothetical protein n=1 Tax=Rhizobium populisoli TaxID=2859785 RepID=UPI001CA56FD9|nr:hypothetical protein [Rhizobium populisoli]MBW6423547.1 hypothetical protein [Rhizobium populisoli]